MSAVLGSSTVSAGLSIVFVAGGTQAGGLEFFSSPWAYKDILPNIFENEITSGEIAGWNVVSESYVYQGGSDSSPTLVTITPGSGYWAVFPSVGEHLLYLGTPASTTVPTVVNLYPGWNAIGDPYTSTVYISTLTFGSKQSTFSAATSGSGALISPTLYYFRQGVGGTTGTYIAASSGTALTPGKGYWIYAFAQTTVTFPLPAPAASERL